MRGMQYRAVFFDLGGVVLGVAQQIGAQINISDETLAGFIVFLVVLALRPQGLISRGAQS